jgi:phosphoenolpyruvate carboxylase
MNGIQGCHRYIISNSEDIYSVLFVFGLFRWIHKTNAFSFDIVPLFETMKGMDASEQVMIELYKLKSYNKHLQNRNKKQTIMLGFSDGTKDGGYLKANWSIYKCKEVLATISKRYDILPVFFDGRGGPPARGGGKTFNFYAARSPIMANNDIQLTIQGQTITSTYGTREKFNFNAEQMITSGLSSLDPNSNSEISESQRDLLEELSTLSYNKYIALKEDPKFLPYLEQLTTLKFYSETNIGSRPGRRNKSSKLSLKDLRAISYVGSWSQIKQNIPGYYGVGTAIKELSEKGKMHEVQKLYNEVPFFKTLIDNSMMSLTKCFFALTSYIRSNEEFSAFWNMLYDEFELSTRMILEISQMDTLMENEKSSKESILVRNELVQPLLLIQHYALQMLNSGYEPENKAVFEKIVVRSLYGNINASRNSA